MADSGDVIMDLADKLVTALSATFKQVAIGDQLHDVTIEWAANPYIALEDARLQSPLIFVVDNGEVLETVNELQREDVELLIVMQMKLAAVMTAAEESIVIRALSKVMNDVARLLRPMDEAYELELDAGGATCVKIERMPARNFEALQQERLFRAGLVATFRRW
jgi:hypothetical protein